MAKFLTEEDHRDLRRILAQWRARPQNRAASTSLSLPGQTPDVYVAQAPSGGLPALSGTTPGQAECDIYKIVEVTGVPTLISAGIMRAIYNLSATAITSGWFQVNRDKFGKWLAVAGGSVSTNYYLMLRDMDDDTYSSLANPLELLDAGFLYDPEEGQVNTTSTVIVIDPSLQLPAWAGDIVQCSSVAVDGYSDTNGYEGLVGGPKYVMITHRMSQQLSFPGFIMRRGGMPYGQSAAVALLINSAGLTIKTAHDHLLAPGQTIPPFTPVIVDYWPNARKFFVVGAPCLLS
ncbi:MAG: hypothetical protein WC485_00095 [Opitutaceae bacterium]